MFKKLKDKIAEEVKQSPLRLPTSVQQHLSQTLVDIAEDGEAGINAFSIADVDSRPSSPSGSNKEGRFQPVNLNEPKREMTTSTPQSANHTGRLSRQSSLSSVFSDVSFLPGSSDPTYHPYQFQSDLESNVSEFDDSASQSGTHAVDRISKEHVYNAYQKMRVRYHKYKGRYSDLARHYKELERDREKVKHVLTETQDRSLRRISELKEQCVLEQQAKAHLEEILRSDLEEKDNLIAVLQTKVKLLASPSPSISEGPLVDLNNSETASSKSFDETDKDVKGEATDNEVQLLKEKLQRFESLLMKCKENIKSHIERNSELQAENETFKQKETQKNEEIDSVQKMHRDQLAQLTESLNMARTEIETLRRQEQEAALASAETKQKVHAELVKQEEEMVRLRNEREQLNNKVTLLETEMDKIKEQTSKQLQDAEAVLEVEKQKLLKELSRGKTEALKLMDEDMGHRLEDSKKERDAHWEAVLQKKLSEEAENHARVLRQTEEHYRSRLAEMQEEKTLALEEKELHCASLISREKNNQQGLQEEISNLKSEIENKEKIAEKAREESLEERRSWVQQIEENRERHLEEIQSVSLQNKKLVEEIEERHQNAIDTAVLGLKQQHTMELEKYQLQHEELLQAANEDMESSAKNQIQQLRTLLRDKDSETSQHSATLQEFQELLKSKELNISDLSSQINVLQERVTSMNAVSEQLNSALEQTKLLEPLNLELQKMKDEAAYMISQMRQLEEERDVFKNSSIQLQESEKECEKLKLQIEDSTAAINENKKQLELLDAMKLEIAELKDSMDQKEKLVFELQDKAEKAVDSANAKESEYQQITEKLNERSQTVQAELTIVKLALEKKDEQIAQLEQAVEKTKLLEPLNLELDKAKEEIASMTSRMRQLEEERDALKNSSVCDSVQVSRLKEQLEESEKECEKLKFQLEDSTVTINQYKKELELLDAMKLEIAELKDFVDQKEKLVLELQAKAEKAIDSASAKESELQQITEELNKQSQAVQEELTNVKSALDAKYEQVAQLEQAQSTFIASESQLKNVIEEKDLQISSSEAELVTLRSSLKNQEDSVSKMIEERSELERAKEEIAQQLAATQADLSAICQVKDQRITELQGEIEQAKFNVTTRDAEWDLKTHELSTKLEATNFELEELRSSISAKEERVHQLEQAQNQWVFEESSLKLIVDENEKRLTANDTELETLRKTLDSKEKRIDELQEELQQISLNLNIQDSELKQNNRDLSDSLKSAQSELDELKAKLLQTNVLSTEWEEKTNELSNQLETAQNELQTVNCTLQTKEEQVLQMENEIKQKQNLVNESQQQLADSELQLNSIRQSLNDSERQISEFKETLSSLEITASESTRQIELLNHSLAVKESVIIDLQSEVARNGQLMSEIQTLAEGQRQQLLVEKDTLAEQYKSQISSVESEWQSTVADLNDKLSIMKKAEEQSRLQLAAKEDAIREMETNYSTEMQKVSQNSLAALSSTQLLDQELLQKKNELDVASARADELEMKLQSLVDQQALNESEKEILRTENDKLKEDLESKKIETGALELMENKIKSLNGELSTLAEEKSRLENLCKRFKVQLADTRKLLSATKSAEANASKEIEVSNPPKEAPVEAKINNIMQAELNQNELKGHDPKELLQQQIANLQKELEVVRHQHQVEATELRRVIELGKTTGSGVSGASNGVENNFHGSLEEATELEYLRNIMFEYMMGRQPATLSKVVAAIVKFTPEQTRRIAEKEEQRQSLLGHLGLA
ncbi:golgin subfamily A member 4-like isoform X2 [Daphnia pulex]|uniref:golgin subfamily A member 4-like isoform X2 n=1 Tax=Daphnia pulex TaxID=6669 RepID=UPI001EDD2366|nr:golgin subfamily A member 4-like isoform X2 [Daphnia pulex]